MVEKTNDVIGIGNLMIDFLVKVEDYKLAEFDLKKGEMHLIEEEKALEILNKIRLEGLQVETAPGGSAANTLRGIGFLGGKAILCGKVGTDQQGEFFIQQIKNHHVTAKISQSNSTTGHSISFITPDSERTMSTCLGASLELSKDDINEEDIMKSKILHLEAYQLEGPTKEVILYAIELAKNHDTLISIDLADPGLIQRNREFFKELVTNSIDIVFVNENEAIEFTGREEEDALRKLAQDVKVAVVKLGEKGSLISHNNETIKVAAHKVNDIDTTGAGDTFAAGSLYGLSEGWQPRKAGELGSLMAAKIVEKVGVKINELDVEQIKNSINENSESEEEEEPGSIEEVSVNEEVKKKDKIKIGIIGGSGLNNPDILQNAKDIEMETPYGNPTSSLKVGTINGTDVGLIARHGREHPVPPTQVNFRANIWALKEQGCTHILATTACGSLRQDVKRGDFVILDQFIDFTRHRKITFHEHFNPGEVKHTPMATPFSNDLRNRLILTAEELNLRYHPEGTVVTIEGPRFSTKAESQMYRGWGADVINMSIAPEATLANEIEIPYAAIAMSTDYDCWKEDEEPVTWEEILQVFKQNVEKVTSLLINTIPKIEKDIESEIASFNSEDKDLINNLLDSEEEYDLKKSIRTVPDWPKPGIQFRDITTLLEDPEAFNEAVQRLVDKYQDKGLTKIAGIDSRGFIFGAPLALELGLPFVLIRKKGKLPAETVGQEYSLEYGTDTIEVHKNSISEGDKVLIVDDLIATAGTMKAAVQIVEKLGGNVQGCCAVIELPDLNGRKVLEGYEVLSLIEFEGE